eukprot:symbB.v1.2.030520.t1/scaffold3447.1/size56486/5
MLIGGVFGVLGGLFNLAHDQVTRCCAKFWKTSKTENAKWAWRDLIFVAFVAALNVLLVWKVPLLKGRSQPVLLNNLFSKEFFQSNEVNSNDVYMMLLALLVKVITTLLALSMPTPTGVIAPSLVLGALLMRCFTSLLPERCFVPLLGSDSSSELDAFEARLAILGASAFGCAVVRAYGIAITVFEVLSLNEMVVPLSLSSLTAIFVADYISFPFFDKALVRKGWYGLSNLTCTDHGEEPAFMVMQPFSDFPSVPEFARLEDIDRALNAEPPEFSFPVVGTDAFLLKEHPHHRNLRGAVSRISLEEARRQLQALEVKHSEVPILTL